MELNDIIKQLYALEDPENVVYRAKKYGIISNNSLGITMKKLKEIAKGVKYNTNPYLEFELNIKENFFLF